MARGARIGIAVVIIIAILAAAVVAALTVINRRAEQEVARALDDAIAANGLGPFVTYGDVDVQAARGTLVLRRISGTEPTSGVTFGAERVSMSVPPAEIVAFMQRPETARMSHGTVAVDGLEIDAATLGLGDISLVGMRLTVSGVLPPDGATLEEQLADLDSVETSLTGLEIRPGATLVAQLQSVGAAPHLLDAGNWRIDAFDLTARLDGTAVTFDELAIDGPLMAANGSGSVEFDSFGGPVASSATITYEELDPAFRAFLAESMAAGGVSIPAEEAFTVTTEVGRDGALRFELE